MYYIEKKKDTDSMLHNSVLTPLFHIFHFVFVMNRLYDILIWVGEWASKWVSKPASAMAG